MVVIIAAPPPDLEPRRTSCRHLATLPSRSFAALRGRSGRHRQEMPPCCAPRHCRTSTHSPPLHWLTAPAILVVEPRVPSPVPPLPWSPAAAPLCRCHHQALCNARVFLRPQFSVALSFRSKSPKITKLVLILFLFISPVVSNHFLSVQIFQNILDFYRPMFISPFSPGDSLHFH